MLLRKLSVLPVVILILLIAMPAMAGEVRVTGDGSLARHYKVLIFYGVCEQMGKRYP